jgi:hypothetical protein
MFIAQDIQKRRKPRRGGMERGEGHAAPTGLAGIIGGAVTITMALLRSWARTASRCECCPERPNKTDPPNPPMMLLFHISHPWRRGGDLRRST